MVQLPTVDVSVAVATPTGLITPIITGADGRGVANISETVKEMAGRGRGGKLLPHEFQGGTFSVSNLGMFGITSFSAVINPPQSCILAVGGTTPKVLVDDEGNPNIRQMGSFTISSGARVTDDEVAGCFFDDDLSGGRVRVSCVCAVRRQNATGFITIISPSSSRAAAQIELDASCSPRHALRGVPGSAAAEGLPSAAATLAATAAESFSYRWSGALRAVPRLLPGLAGPAPGLLGAAATLAATAAESFW